MSTERNCTTCRYMLQGACMYLGMCVYPGSTERTAWEQRADASAADPTTFDVGMRYIPLSVAKEAAIAAAQEPAGGANGEQPAPTPNDHPAAWSLVMQDMVSRDLLGLKRYGTRLQPHNGRDSLRDAYEEALDLAVYLRNAIFERDGK